MKGLLLFLVLGLTVSLMAQDKPKSKSFGNDDIVPQTNSQDKPKNRSLGNDDIAPADPSLSTTEGEFVNIPAGTFIMGSNKVTLEQPHPEHKVTISKGFDMGKYEVTQKQWELVMGNNPSYFKGNGSLPVEQVSWREAQFFIENLNSKSKSYIYRLPTEAEWEYACRAGDSGDSESNLNSLGWYTENSGAKTHPVGQKKPNAWGLYDMHGNVAEWCADSYIKYPQEPVTDPKGGGILEPYRVIRGGNWFCNSLGCRSVYRSSVVPDYRDNTLGFRLVRTHK